MVAETKQGKKESASAEQQQVNEQGMGQQEQPRKESDLQMEVTKGEWSTLARKETSGMRLRGATRVYADP